METCRKPGLPLALLPIVLTFLVLGTQLFIFDTFTPHVPLAIGIAFIAVMGRYLNHVWTGWFSPKASEAEQAKQGEEIMDMAHVQNEMRSRVYRVN